MILAFSLQFIVVELLDLHKDFNDGKFLQGSFYFLIGLRKLLTSEYWLRHEEKLGSLNIGEVNEGNNFVLDDSLADSLADCFDFLQPGNSYEETEDLLLGILFLVVADF